MKRELITYYAPKDPTSEMFRNLRTNIQFMNTNIKALLVTSTMSGEGKSFISSNLAVTFAQAGKKVVLIDSDMRKGRLHNIFEVSPRPGLSNYLSGVIPPEFKEDKNDITNFVQETEVENLYVITAGNIPPNPSELLISPKMSRLIRDLSGLCDIIIFDSTPSLIVTDAVVLARQVDSTLIVASHNQTKKDNIQKVRNAIEQVGGKVLGVVLNKMPVSSKKYENSYYYYGERTSLKPSNTNNKSRKWIDNLEKDFSDSKKEHNEPKSDMSIDVSSDAQIPKDKIEQNPNSESGEFNDETKRLLEQINNYIDEAKKDLDDKK